MRSSALPRRPAPLTRHALCPLQPALASIVTTALALGVTLLIAPSAPGQSAPLEAAWNGGAFNWTDPTRWNPAGVPNNAAGATYNAEINAANSNVRLTQNIAIESLRWFQGTVSRQGAGPFTLTVNQGLHLDSNVLKTLNGVRLVVAGDSRWTNNGNFSLTSASVENRGTFALSSDADLVGTGSFLNAAGATFRKREGTDISQLGAYPGLPVTNHGTVDVQSGTIEWLGSAVHTGTFQAAAGATLRFGRGTNRLEGAARLVLPAGATLAVRDTPGMLRLATDSPLDLAGRLESRSSARMVIDTPTRAAELTLDNATLEGTAPVQVTTRFDWGTGTLGGGGSLILGPGATLNLAPLNATRTLNQRTLQLENEVDWGATHLAMGAAATLVLRSNVAVQAGAQFSAPVGQSAHVRNEGVLVQERGSTGASTQVGLTSGGAITLDNLGRVEVGTNTLVLPFGGTHSGAFQVTSQATLVLGGEETAIHSFGAGAFLELPVAESTLELRVGTCEFASGQTTPQAGRLRIQDARLVVQAGTSLVFGQLQELGTAGAIQLAGGEIGSSGTIQLTGSLTGQGQVRGNPTCANLVIAPGDLTRPQGILTFAGAPNFAATTSLAIELGGTTPGTDFDQVLATGLVSLNNARLQVTFARDFEKTVTAADRFLILRAAGLQGAFANLPNVPSGSRLPTADGYGSFRVEYSANDVVLSDFQPELARAELEAWEPFDYALTIPPAPVATPLSKNGGAGFLGAWTSSTGSSTEFRIVEDSLPHPSLNRVGNHVGLTLPRSSFSLLQRPLQYRLGTPGRTRYVSALLRPVAPLTPTGFFGLLFQRPTPLVGAVPPNLFVGKPGGGATDRFVIEEAGGHGQQPAGGAALVPGDTYLLVVKLESTSGADRVSLFVNPSPGQPEPASADAVKGDFDVGLITSVALNSAGAWEFDELRIGSTWASVTRTADFRPPLAIAPLPDAIVEEGATLDLTPQLVESVAPRTVQWDLPTKPDGMSIDASSGRIRWTPAETDGRPDGAPGFLVVVRVRDFPEPSATSTYNFSVAARELNSAPGLDLSSLGSNEVAPGEPFHRSLRATDSDVPANPVTFTLVEGPPGLSLTPTGGLDWTPPANQALGPVNVVVELEDFNADALRDSRLRGRGFFTLNVVPRTDLRLTVVTSPSDPLIAGQRGQYQVKVENLGPTLAQAVEVRFSSSVPFVPPATGLTVTETSSSQASSPPGIENDQWVFHLGDLAVGASATVQMEMLFAFPQLYSLTWEANSATAESRGQDNRVDLTTAVSTLPLDNPESWQFSPVEEEGLTGAEVVMAIDPADGLPVLAWFNESYHELRYARRRGLEWEVQTVRQFSAGDRIVQRGGLALQPTPAGPRFAYVISPELGRTQIRYVVQQPDLSFTEQTVYEPSKPVGSLQFFGVPTTLPILWFTEETRLVQAEKSASSTGGWLTAAYPLPVGTTAYASGRPFSIARGQSMDGQHTGYLILEHADRALELVEASVPTADGGRFESIATLTRTHLPLYVSSSYSDGTTHLAYTLPDPGFLAPDGDAYRLRIAHAEKSSEPWRRDEPLTTPVGVTGSCTRPIVVVDTQGIPRIVFTCTSQTADTATLQLPDGSDREYRRTWQVARRLGTSWSTEEIYASVDRSFGVSLEEQRTPVRQPDDPALAAAADSTGALLVAAHTGWPNENLVFGRFAPRWQVFPVAPLTTDFAHRPSLALGAEGEPYVTWNEIPATGSFELHSAFLSDRGGRAGFLLGPSTNLTGTSPAEGSVLGADYRIHAVISDFGSRRELRELQWTPGATDWSGGPISFTAHADLREPELVVFPDALGAVTSDAAHRPAFYTRTWGSSPWSEMPTNTISPGGVAPARRSVTVPDERVVASAVFVAYVPDRPNGSAAPFEVRVATFREGQWSDELVTTISDSSPPLLDAKWLWHAPLEPSNRGYLYLAITGSPDPESRRPLHVLRRNLNRADAPWEDARLEQVAPDYLRDLRLSGRRESLRLGYVGSSGRLYLASADLALDFDRVRRATVERVPIDGAVDEFDLASQAEGTWFVVARDHKLAAIGMGPFSSFVGIEGTPPAPQSGVPAAFDPFLQLSKDCQCLLTMAASMAISAGPVNPQPNPMFQIPLRDLFEMFLSIQAGCAGPPHASPALQQGTSATRQVATAPPSPALFHSIRDLMTTTTEGKRLVDLYYRHEAAARAVLWEHPSLGMRLAFLLLNFSPALREWREGRGATALLTPGMIEELNALWGSVAALGSPDLKAALETERTRFHGFQDFVGKNMDEWSALLAIPSTAPAAAFRIVSAQRTEAGFRVQVDAAADAVLRLERTSQLVPATWSAVANATQTTQAGRAALTDPAPPTGSAFYRVTQSLPSAASPHR